MEIRTRLREQPKVQGREVHHRDGTYDKGQWMGLTKSEQFFFYLSNGLALDFVQRLCFIHNVKRAFILEQTTQTF